MKVGELIGLLSKFDPDREILICGPVHPDFDYYNGADVFKAEGTLKLIGRTELEERHE